MFNPANIIDYSEFSPLRAQLNLFLEENKNDFPRVRGMLQEAANAVKAVVNTTSVVTPEIAGLALGWLIGICLLRLRSLLFQSYLEIKQKDSSMIRASIWLKCPPIWLFAVRFILIEALQRLSLRTCGKMQIYVST